MELISVHVDPMATFCDHNNGAYDFTQGGDFLDYLSDYQVLKRNSAP
jgi:hypothetical protein